ncbi:MAG: PAS domain S-box protein [Anaerolineae bacterium]|nr:PAS domain S-box protein [Anaerolineae bacterium]
MLYHIRKWLTPPTFPDEDKTLSAALLQAILEGLAVWMGLGLLINILVGAANPSNIIVGIVSIVLLLILRRIGRTGRVRLTTLLTSTLLLILVTIAVYNLGTIRTILLAYYFIAFVLPTLLLGPRTGLFFAIMCILAVLGLRTLEEAGRLPGIAPPTTSNQVVVFAEVVLILFAIPYLARKVMTGALARARSEIGERRRAEEAVRRSEEKYRKLIETTDTGFVIVDDAGKVLDANPGYVSLTGHRDLKDIMGRSIAEWTAQHEIEKNLAAVKQCIEQGFIRNLEISYVDMTGKITPIEINATLDHTIAGLQILSLCRDITERKQADDELRKHREHLEELVTQRTIQLRSAYEQLETLSQAKDEFITNVSHELRTPLASLKVHYHLLKEKPEQISKYLTTMQRETDRLHRTIEALLHLSRLDRGSVTPKPVSLNLGKLVEQYVQDRMLLALDKALTLTYSSANDLPMVNADPELLGDTVSILLTNAINYTPAQGQVKVTVQTRQKRKKTWVGFSVSDTGPGIAPDEQAHIFERFFRGSVGQGSGIPGTGLGLAIAHDIIEKHKGIIEVHSPGIPGKGAMFGVWLIAESK